MVISYGASRQEVRRKREERAAKNAEKQAKLDKLLKTYDRLPFAGLTVTRKALVDLGCSDEALALHDATIKNILDLVGSQVDEVAKIYVSLEPEKKDITKITRWKNRTMESWRAVLGVNGKGEPV